MKKAITYIIINIAILSLLSFPHIFAEELTEAPVIEAEVKLSTNEPSSNLLDEQTYTKLILNENTKLSINSNDYIYGVYFLWDKPAEYTISAGGELYYGGRNKFIHEYIPFRTEQKSLEVTVPFGGILCDIYVIGKGTVPSWVQQWQPPYEKADLIIFSTHADDEHLFFGGTMPYYAGELNLDVQVCYFTNHWAESYRTHELLNGLWIVGITAYPVISENVDIKTETIEEAKELYGEEEAIKYQTELIRRFKPYVVLGHDLNGEYGHGTHMLNAYAVTKALEVCGDEEIYPDLVEKYGIWDPLKTYLHLYPENKILIEWDKPLNRFNGKTGFDMAIEGFACHKSQQKWFSVRKTGVHDCRAFGLYKSLVGEDILKNDFFENIDLEILNKKNVMSERTKVLIDNYFTSDESIVDDEPPSPNIKMQSFILDDSISVTIFLLAMIDCFYVLVHKRRYRNLSNGKTL